MEMENSMNDKLCFSNLRDIYGRPLPVPQWMTKPTIPGYYFFAGDKKNWDIARPFPIIRIEEAGGKVQMIIQFPNEEKDIATIDGAVYFGPLRMAKPDWV